jgi:Predicted 3'-5' exonuclease related to the exonuclease domain of PolB
MEFPNFLAVSSRPILSNSPATAVWSPGDGDYFKSDVINTYRLWLRHELLRGRLDQAQFRFSDEAAAPAVSLWHKKRRHVPQEYCKIPSEAEMKGFA